MSMRHVSSVSCVMSCGASTSDQDAPGGDALTQSEAANFGYARSYKDTQTMLLGTMHDVTIMMTYINGMETFQEGILPASENHELSQREFTLDLCSSKSKCQCMPWPTHICKSLMVVCMHMTSMGLGSVSKLQGKVTFS